MRGALLAFLVLGVGSLSFLLWFGSAGRSNTRPTTSSERAKAQGEDSAEEYLISGEGFDFSFQQGETTLFRVKADRQLADRDQNVFLEDVLIEVPRSGGTYLIRGDKARIHRETTQAQLEGNVVVDAPGDVQLETDWLQLRNGGNILIASKGTRIRSEGLVEGTAENLRIHLKEELLVVDGGVHFESVPGVEVPFSLDAEIVRFSRPARVLRAEGEVDVQWGSDSLQARRVTIRLDELLKEVRQVRALWRVRGAFTPPVDEGMSPTRIAISGWLLNVFFEAETKALAALELEGRDQRRAIMIARDETGLERELRGKMLMAGFSNGLLNDADAIGPMILIERQLAENNEGPAVEIRTAEARGARARFDSTGGLVRIDLNGDVRVVQEDITAEGRLAYLDFAGQSSQLMGEPVVVSGDQGEMRAPRMVYRHDTGLVHASEGVRTLLREGVGGSSAPLGGAGPVRVTSEEAFLRNEPEQEFIFKGTVRAWQGSNLILAEQLRGNQTTKQLSASGSVKTVYRPEKEEAAAISEAPSPDLESPPPDTLALEEGDVDLERAPIEITAEYLSYSEALGSVLYDGGVKALQAGRTLTCREMEVDLGEEQEAERMECRGDATLIDPVQRATVSGDLAIYDVMAKTVQFLGTPVRMNMEEDDRLMEGPEFLYRLEDGSIAVGRLEAVEEPSP